MPSEQLSAETIHSGAPDLCKMAAILDFTKNSKLSQQC